MPKSTNSTDRFRLMWKEVLYQPGELKAVAYKEGRKIGEQIVKTSGEAYILKLTPDRKTIKADGRDLSYILVEAYDKDGNFCPVADNKVEITLQGPGKIAGVGNGNPQSFNPFQSNSVNLFYGKAMIIIQSAEAAGNISIDVSAKGLKETRDDRGTLPAI